MPSRQDGFVKNPLFNPFPLHLQASHLLHSVKTKKRSSKYSNENQVSDDEFQFNCYGFVNHCIQEVCPKAYDELVEAMNGPLAESVPPSTDGTPCPFNYAAIFQEMPLTYWTAIPDLSDARPGDLMIYLPPKYQPLKEPDPQAKRTGTHAMIIDTVHGENNGSFHFQIIDSTRIPHSKHDSRYPGKNGIGESPLFLTPCGDNYWIQWKSDGRRQEKEIFLARLNTHFSSPPVVA